MGRMMSALSRPALLQAVTRTVGVARISIKISFILIAFLFYAARNIQALPEGFLKERRFAFNL
jgi:hypothetical protein